MKTVSKLLSLVAGTALAATVGTVPALAAAFTLDFETDPFGNELDAYEIDSQSGSDRLDVGSIWAPLGINISSNGTLGLFNSNCLAKGGTSASGFTDPCNTSNNNGDPDLATGTGTYRNVSYDTAPQGNLLIIEENPGNGTPDDVGGGTQRIVFDFEREAIAVVESFTFVDDTQATVKVFYTDNSEDQFGFEIFEENGLKVVDNFLDKAVSRLEIAYNGSGGIGKLTFSDISASSSAIPEGETALGLLVAGGIFGVRKFRKPSAVQK